MRGQRLQPVHLILWGHLLWLLLTVGVLVGGNRRCRSGTGGNLGTHDSPSAFFAWLLTMALAMTLTMSVMTNSIRPAAINSAWRCPNASGKFSAISEGIVALVPELISDQENAPGDRTMVTAMVSPSARPRANMIEEMIPARANGKTVILIISQRVAPKPRAASS